MSQSASNTLINLYSDTQTRPSQAMREAMAYAEVGDEQRGADPTVNRLCERVAAMLGKPRAVFMPSGTMCNEISILVHCRPGDEIYAHRSAHIIDFEGGGPSAFAGAQIRPLDGPRGQYDAETLRAAISNGSRYAPRPALVEVEQSTNMGGGAVWPLAAIDAVCEVARERELATHMDGARLLNAVASSGVEAAAFAASMDSVWIDLSKGLGCPVGAVLAGSDDFIEQAWRWKQRMGGAMRQAGIIAAAGLYALDHHVERLCEDHAHATKLASELAKVPGVALETDDIETNIFFFDVSGCKADAPTLSAALEKRGVLIGAMGEHRMRAVTHLDVSAEQVDIAASIFADVVDKIGA